MNFSEAIRSCLTQYASFRGRAARSEFWFFALFNISCLIIASIIDNMLGTTFKFMDPTLGVQRSIPYGWFYSLVALGLFLPNISALVRRLHDTGRSGWWYWILLIPFVGAILLLVWFCTRGTQGENNYGHDPLAGGIAQTFN